MEGSRINLNLLGIKARTKNELYRLLTTEANLYLPPQKETSIYFVRDIVQDRKKVSLFFYIFCVQAFYMEQVKPRSVPQIKGLRVEDFVYFIETEVDNGIDYLPQNYKEITLNRQWIVNLCTLFIILL